MPNPDGSDSGAEWIELHNTGNTAINLGNWTLDDAEEGSKPYALPDTLTIEGETAIVVKSDDSKLSLGNKEDEIRLFNPEGELMFSVPYESAPSGESLARISIEDESEQIEHEWSWTKTPTPAEINPHYQKFTITILEDAVFAETYSFIAEKNDTSKITVLFDDSAIPGPLAKTTFTANTKADIVVEKISDNTFQLQQFSNIVKPESQSDPANFLFMIIVGFIIIAAAAFFGIKKIKWKPKPKSV